MTNLKLMSYADLRKVAQEGTPELREAAERELKLRDAEELPASPAQRTARLFNFMQDGMAP